MTIMAVATESDDQIAVRKSESCIPEEPDLTDVPVHAVSLKHKELRSQSNIIRKQEIPSNLDIDFTNTPSSTRPRRASTQLLDLKSVRNELHKLLGDSSATNLLPAQCCGGNCCLLETGTISRPDSPSFTPCKIPDNEAFQALELQLRPLSVRSKLTGTTALPSKTIKFEGLTSNVNYQSTVETHPPEFVTPHPPYQVYSAKIHDSRSLTAEGAEKRTYHFDLDVTDYPEEAEGVDFRVGGAIGICAPNDAELVNSLFDILNIPRSLRDRPITVRTEGGRWPTIWGVETKRTLTSTRRELLTWTVDVQSYAPTKPLLRIIAEYATNEDEKKILLYLCSRQGQAAFCELRTGPYVTLIQLLNAFPSSKPPLEHLLEHLQPLMPRFYSLSSDPHVSKHAHRRTIEMAVTVHEMQDWTGSKRSGVASGYMERMARKYITDSENNKNIDLRIPMFRGLMENPMAKEFRADGPMLLIGAGVGVAPFRGFVQRRLQNANCANKVWVLQGIRDSLLDELYSGEWGAHENDIKKVVESRTGTGKYVQEEVLNQAELVWFIINSIDGRVFVCGSTKGMGEGVEAALVQVAMEKGQLRKSEAEEFWQKKKDSYQYITETW